VLLFFGSWPALPYYTQCDKNLLSDRFDSLPPVRGKGTEGKIFFTQIDSPKKNKRKRPQHKLLAIINNLWGLGDLLFFSGNFKNRKM
jgi:hypothetical protein